MRITVCEFPDETRHKGAAWSALSDYLNSEPAEVVVLPEMPFADWSVFMEKEVDLAVWKNTLDSHREMEQKLGDLNTGIVLGSRPIQIAEQRLNQAFVWTRDDGCRGVRVKYYLPDEPVGWEATWFDQRDLDFASTPVGNLNVGFQICTEMLLSERSREIGASGGQLIAAPRATANHAAGQLPREWPRLCLVCFVASANRRSLDSDTWPGDSWVVSPEGEVLASTSQAQPFASVDIDPADADKAKGTYPRNVLL